jgi:integration host factor subunit alpha
MTITKAELISQICKKHGLKKPDATHIVEGMFEIMKATLERGENIKISGFGNFVVRTKRPRMGRNPKTGEEMLITGREVLTFKPSHILKKSISKSSA